MVIHGAIRPAFSVRLAESAFLDMSSIRLGMRIYNLSTTGAAPNQVPGLLTPLCGPFGMFSRARLYVAGQLAEDLTECGHSSVMMERMKPNARRINDSMEAHAMTGANSANESYSAIPAGESRKVVCSLPFGLTNQN